MSSPEEIAEYYAELGVKKANAKLLNLVILSIFGSAIIGLASASANTAISTVDNASLAKLLSALIFPAGLSMVLFTSTELFSSGCVVSISVMSGKLSLLKLLKYWFIIYIGNLVGGVLVAYLINVSTQLNLFDKALALITIKTAYKKLSFTFTEAVLMGTLCNFLVCVAVFIAAAGKNITEKIAGLYFPILLFVLAGYEHSVANMYYIPAGIIAAQNPEFAAMATEYGIAVEKLNFSNFFINNLLPVTIGNAIGGALLVSGIYYLLYLRHAD